MRPAPHRPHGRQPETVTAMLEPRQLRTFTRKRFDPARMRIDPARIAQLRDTRAARIAQLLGRQTPYQLDAPWLTLRPDQPIVPGKGWVEYVSPSSVGMGQFADGSYMYAAFDLIFRKDMPSSYSVERPQVLIRLVDPPTTTMLIEVDLHCYDFPPGDPEFEVQAANHQVMTISEGHRETIMFVMRDFASIQSAWADGEKFWDRDGNWAFFEARISAID